MSIDTPTAAARFITTVSAPRTNGHADKTQRQDNLGLVRRVIEEIINHGDYSAFHRYMTADYVWHPADGVSGPMDRDMHAADYEKLRGAFPDLKLQIEDMVADGEKVVTRFTMTGTHKGVLLKSRGGSVNPTGKTLQWAGIVVHVLRDGKIAEGWINYDYSKIMVQLDHVFSPMKP